MSKGLHAYIFAARWSTKTGNFASVLSKKWSSDTPARLPTRFITGRALSPHVVQRLRTEAIRWMIRCAFGVWIGCVDRGSHSPQITLLTTLVAWLQSYSDAIKQIFVVFAGLPPFPTQHINSIVLRMFILAHTSVRISRVVAIAPFRRRLCIYLLIPYLLICLVCLLLEQIFIHLRTTPEILLFTCVRARVWRLCRQQVWRSNARLQLPRVFGMHRVIDA